MIQLNLIDIYRTFHPKTMNFTFFSSAHVTFSRIDHILGHKSSLGKFKKIEIIPSIFSDHNATRLDVNWLWCWEGLGAGGEGNDRGWDGWMASLNQWMWVWVNSGSWWWTRRPGVLRFMGSQRVRHDSATELNWTGEKLLKIPTYGGWITLCWLTKSQKQSKKKS